MENQLSTKYWVKTLFLLVIPIVNLVLLILWAFGEENPRKNFSRAALLVSTSLIGLSIFLGLIGEVLAPYSPETGPVSTDIPGAMSQYEQQRDTALNEDLEIVDISIISIDNSDRKEIIGKVKNNSTTVTYSSFVIECNVYDEENSIIQTVEITVDDKLPPNETMKFSEWRIHGDAFSVKPIKIREKTFMDF